MCWSPLTSPRLKSLPSSPSVSYTTPFSPLQGSVYYGGYTFMLLHFGAINVGLIDAKGVLGTGTTTVFSWFVGWLVCFYVSVVLPSTSLKPAGGQGRQQYYVISRALRSELILVLTQLFVLAVGAGAFSRFYYGWMAGRPKDIFQSLSVKYLERKEVDLDGFLGRWWIASVTSRFTGLGWWCCEIVDPLFHQVPFLALAYLTYSHPSLQNIHCTELVSGSFPLVALTSLVGPSQRFFWDLSTCGTTVCDGPYHGFLSHISPYEQMFWHTAPGVFFCAALWGKYRYVTRCERARVEARDAERADVYSTSTSTSTSTSSRGRRDGGSNVNDNDIDNSSGSNSVLDNKNVSGDCYSVVKTFLFILAWGLGQVYISHLKGGNVFKEGWWWIDKNGLEV